MTEQGRLVEDVLEKVLKVIPSNELELINEFNLFKKSLHNKAPEMRRGPYCWQPFLNILNFYIPNKEEEWHFKIKDILENPISEC